MNTWKQMIDRTLLQYGLTTTNTQKGSVRTRQRKREVTFEERCIKITTRIKNQMDTLAF